LPIFGRDAEGTGDRSAGATLRAAEGGRGFLKSYWKRGPGDLLRKALYGGVHGFGMGMAAVIAVGLRESARWGGKTESLTVLFDLKFC